MTTKFYSLVVGTDPQDDRYLSLWTNEPGAVNAEIAGRICDRRYADRLAIAFNASLAEHAAEEEG